MKQPSVQTAEMDATYVECPLVEQSLAHFWMIRSDWMLTVAAMIPWRVNSALAGPLINTGITKPLKGRKTRWEARSILGALTSGGALETILAKL